MSWERVACAALSAFVVAPLPLGEEREAASERKNPFAMAGPLVASISVLHTLSCPMRFTFSPTAPSTMPPDPEDGRSSFMKTATRSIPPRARRLAHRTIVSRSSLSSTQCPGSPPRRQRAQSRSGRTPFMSLKVATDIGRSGAITAGSGSRLTSVPAEDRSPTGKSGSNSTRYWSGIPMSPWNGAKGIPALPATSMPMHWRAVSLARRRLNRRPSVALIRRLEFFLPAFPGLDLFHIERLRRYLFTAPSIRGIKHDPKSPWVFRCLFGGITGYRGKVAQQGILPYRLTIDPPFEMVRCQTNLEDASWTGLAGNSCSPFRRATACARSRRRFPTMSRGQG